MPFTCYRAGLLAIAATLLATTCCAPIFAQQNAGGDNVQLNFPNEVELKTFIDYVSQRLEVRILYDSQSVNKKINIKAPGGIPSASLLGVLESALKMNGLALVDADVEGWKRIVPVAELSSIAKPLESGRALQGLPPGAVITQAFLLQRADATQLKQTLTPFLSQKGANIIGQKEGNLLVVTDFAVNVLRISKLIELIDQGESRVALEFIKVKNVEASALSQQLIALIASRTKVQGAGRAAATVDVTSDDRTNQLLIVGDAAAVEELKQVITQLDIPLAMETKVYPFENVAAERIDRLTKELIDPLNAKTLYRSAVDTEGNLLIVTTTAANHERIQTLTEQLDTPVADGQKPVRFYRLKYVTVTDLMDILTGIGGDSGQTDGPRRADVGRMRINPGQRVPGENAAPAPASPIQNLPQPPAFRERENNDARGGAPGEVAPASAIFRPDAVRLSADPNTNTLIIVAEPAVQKMYAELIEELDRPRPQVLIEVKIVVINTSDDFTLGVEVSGGDGVGLKRILGFSSFGLSSVDPVTGALSIIPGLGFNGTLVDPDVADSVVKALAKHNRARVLSSPRILVNDNATGLLTSVAEVPFTSVNASQTVATTSFAGFAEAGTTVSVTPHISEGDHLQLEYKVTVNNFTGSGSGGVPPPRQTDEIDSTITIPDGHTVIVGGLNRANVSHNVTAVPWLEKIPVVRHLFSSQAQADSSSTLFIFLRPVILRDDKFRDLRFISEGDVRQAGLPGKFPHSEPVLIR